MAEYLELERVLDDKNIITVQTKEYGSIDVIPVDTITDIELSDVQPVKHGKWEELTDYGGWGDTHYRCSVCGEEWYLEDGTPQQNNMNFCPRCGAIMDGEQKGEME